MITTVTRGKEEQHITQLFIRWMYELVTSDMHLQSGKFHFD